MEFTTTEGNEMTTTQTTYITTPSTDELETAWFNLMQGELGLDQDNATAEFIQTMVDHIRRMTQMGFPIMEPDGEPLNVVNSAEMARRMVAAYAVLFYG